MLSACWSERIEFSAQFSLQLPETLEQFDYAVVSAVQSGSVIDAEVDHITHTAMLVVQPGIETHLSARVDVLDTTEEHSHLATTWKLFHDDGTTQLVPVPGPNDEVSIQLVERESQSVTFEASFTDSTDDAGVKYAWLKTLHIEIAAEETAFTFPRRFPSRTAITLPLEQDIQYSVFDPSNADRLMVGQLESNTSAFSLGETFSINLGTPPRALASTGEDSIRVSSGASIDLAASDEFDFDPDFDIECLVGGDTVDESQCTIHEDLPTEGTTEPSWGSCQIDVDDPNDRRTVLVRYEGIEGYPCATVNILGEDAPETQPITARMWLDPTWDRSFLVVKDGETTTFKISLLWSNPDDEDQPTHVVEASFHAKNSDGDLIEDLFSCTQSDTTTETDASHRADQADIEYDCTMDWTDELAEDFPDGKLTIVGTLQGSDGTQTQGGTSRRTFRILGIEGTTLDTPVITHFGVGGPDSYSLFASYFPVWVQIVHASDEEDPDLDCELSEADHIRAQMDPASDTPQELENHTAQPLEMNFSAAEDITTRNVRISWSQVWLRWTTDPTEDSPGHYDLELKLDITCNDADTADSFVAGVGFNSREPRWLRGDDSGTNIEQGTVYISEHAPRIQAPFVGLGWAAANYGLGPENADTLELEDDQLERDGDEKLVDDKKYLWSLRPRTEAPRTVTLTLTDSYQNASESPEVTAKIVRGPQLAVLRGEDGNAADGTPGDWVVDLINPKTGAIIDTNEVSDDIGDAKEMWWDPVGNQMVVYGNLGFETMPLVDNAGNLNFGTGQNAGGTTVLTTSCHADLRSASFSPAGRPDLGIDGSYLTVLHGTGQNFGVCLVELGGGEAPKIIQLPDDLVRACEPDTAGDSPLYQDRFTDKYITFTYLGGCILNFAIGPNEVITGRTITITNNNQALRMDIFDIQVDPVTAEAMVIIHPFKSKRQFAVYPLRLSALNDLTVNPQIVSALTIDPIKHSWVVLGSKNGQAGQVSNEWIRPSADDLTNINFDTPPVGTGNYQVLHPVVDGSNRILYGIALPTNGVSAADQAKLVIAPNLDGDSSGFEDIDAVAFSTTPKRMVLVGPDVHGNLEGMLRPNSIATVHGTGFSGDAQKDVAMLQGIPMKTINSTPYSVSFQVPDWTLDDDNQDPGLDSAFFDAHISIYSNLTMSGKVQDGTSVEPGTRWTHTEGFFESKASNAQAQNAYIIPSKSGAQVITHKNDGGITIAKLESTHGEPERSNHTVQNFRGDGGNGFLMPQSLTREPTGQLTWGLTAAGTVVATIASRTVEDADGADGQSPVKQNHRVLPGIDTATSLAFNSAAMEAAVAYEDAAGNLFTKLFYIPTIEEVPNSALADPTDFNGGVQAIAHLRASNLWVVADSRGRFQVRNATAYPGNSVACPETGLEFLALFTNPDRLISDPENVTTHDGSALAVLKKAGEGENTEIVLASIYLGADDESEIRCFTAGIATHDVNGVYYAPQRNLLALMENNGTDDTGHKVSWLQTSDTLPAAEAQDSTAIITDTDDSIEKRVLAAGFDRLENMFIVVTTSADQTKVHRALLRGSN